MRVFIAVLVVMAVGTSVLAYGPRIPVGRSQSIEPETLDVAEKKDQAASEAMVEAAPIEIKNVPDGEIIPGTDGLRRVTGSIQRSINHTLSGKLDRGVADPLTQVVTRVLVWWLNPSRDLQPGDELKVIYSLHDGEEPRVHAVSLSSRRHGRTFSAYAYHPDSSPYRRIYTEDGQEVEKRLVDSPIKEYEQITSLLWDGRGHNGVDFKTPVGSEVYAPFDGTVTRRNWNTRFNGYCLEIRVKDGTSVLFLHLDSFADGMEPGRRVRKGELVAISGNTGRSTAPHLHYELQTPSGRILDPFDVHKTYRERVPEAEKQAFDRHVSMLRSLLSPPEQLADR